MDNITIASTLNGVDIEVTSPLIVLKDTDGEISGSKTFDRYKIFSRPICDAIKQNESELANINLSQI